MRQPLISRPRALAQWTALGASTALRLGPATAIAPLSRVASHEWARRWADVNLDRLGIDVHIDDRSGLGAHNAPAAGTGPGGAGALFVHLNQQTLLSGLIYIRALPAPFALIVNVEFAALPFLGWLTVAQGAVVIVRQWPEQAKRALATVPPRLRAGENFGISIEGQRTKDGSLSPFKKGAVVLAIEAECPIVPFMTHGEYALWPRGQWRIRPGRVDCVVFPPIETRGLGYADRDRLVRQLRDLAEDETARYASQHAT